MRDAQAIVDVIRTLSKHWDRRESACKHTARRALEDFWHAPRLERVGHRTRPEGALWSPAARAQARDADADDRREHAKALGEWCRSSAVPPQRRRPRAPKIKHTSKKWHGLVGEHVVPVDLQVSALCRAVMELPETPLTERNVEDLGRLLTTPMVIITKAEDKKLEEKGLKKTMPGGQPWKPGANDFARYGPEGLGLVDQAGIANRDAAAMHSELEPWFENPMQEPDLVSPDDSQLVVADAPSQNLKHD